MGQAINGSSRCSESCVRECYALISKSASSLAVIF